MVRFLAGWQLQNQRKSAKLLAAQKHASTKSTLSHPPGRTCGFIFQIRTFHTLPVGGVSQDKDGADLP